MVLEARSLWILWGLSLLSPLAAARQLEIEGATRVADPKLEGGAVAAGLRWTGSAGSSVQATAEVWKGASLQAIVWSGNLTSGAPATPVVWDGKDTNGTWCSPGAYTLRLGDGVNPSAEHPLAVVRLGITEIDAMESAAGDDTWPMVYFRKAGGFSHFATPAIAEYRNAAGVGELSHLDLDNGDPRPVPPVHDATDEPVMDGSLYHQTVYNYPLAYEMGVAPRLDVSFGNVRMEPYAPQPHPGYPIDGIDLRCNILQGAQSLGRTPVLAAGDRFTVTLGNLPASVTRVDTGLEFRWQYRVDGQPTWFDLPGGTEIPLRFYTTLGEPIFGSNTSAIAGSGPWVEVAEYYAEWNVHLQLPADDVPSVTQLHVRGFFGQQPGIPTPIEDVLYDAYPLGGDGGATHYFNSSTWRMRLSRLLGDLQFGRYVNCTDNMGAATTMLSMMGVPSMRPVRLGNMSLNAIWGIGAPAYTTDLWGPGSHGFSYHHIVTDDDGTTVTDTCMQLDEDGNPGSTPGVPGWNTHRPWSGIGGYNNLSSTNNVNTSLESLPGVR